MHHRDNTEDCLKVPWTCNSDKRRGQKSVLRGQRLGVVNFPESKYTTIMFSAESLRDLV